MRGEERTRKDPVLEREEMLQDTRVPVSGGRDVLTVLGKDPNFSYRFVNNDPGRIARFTKGGWEVVNDDLVVGAPRLGANGKPGSAAIYHVGGGQEAVLMRIKKEWYDADQAAKARAIDETEDQILNEHKQPGMYGNIEKFKTTGKK